MERRVFLSVLGSAALANSLPAFAQADRFETLLHQIQNDPEMVEQSWIYRDKTGARGVPHGKPSKRLLSQRSIDLIVACEVASEAVYKAKYQRPIWPKGQSGVTIGVGYDLQSANAAIIDRDWPMLSVDDRALLTSVAALKGPAAKAALPRVQSVEISWSDAYTQFLAFLRYPTKQTEDAFPNCGMLSDDSFGALVSLVYNRGPSTHNNKSRKEMYEIKQLMAAEQFDKVPYRIRAMKHLWPGPDQRGLPIRREAEAALFERGRRA